MRLRKKSATPLSRSPGRFRPAPYEATYTLSTDRGGGGLVEVTCRAVQSRFLLTPSRSRLDRFKQARMVKTHLDGIVTAVVQGITNARSSPFGRHLSARAAQLEA